MATTSNRNNETLFSILHLLGFDSASLERQHKITLNSSTFTKPNSKAFEIVIHFLFVQLDVEQASRVFRDCWPAVLKEQQKEFRDSVYSWLLDISSKSKSIRFPHVMKSLLLTPNGPKVYELLNSFSQYVLLARLNQLVDQNKLNVYIWPKLNLQLNEKSKSLTKKQFFQYSITANSFRQKINVEFNEFQAVIKQYFDVKTLAKEYADEKIASLRHLIEARQSMKSRLHQLNENLRRRLGNSSSGGDSTEHQTAMIDAKFHSFLSLWSQFKQLVTSNNNTSRQQVEYVCKGMCNKNVLDGSQLQIEIPEYLMLDYGHTMKNHKIGDVYNANNNKLDLVNLIKLNNLIIMIQGEAMLKIDKKQFSECYNLFEYKNVVNIPLAINERSQEIQKELSVLVPKLSDETRNLKARLLLKSQISVDNMTKTTCSSLIENFFNMFSLNVVPKGVLQSSTNNNSNSEKLKKQKQNFLFFDTSVSNTNDENSDSKENFYLIDSSFNDMKSNCHQMNNSGSNEQHHLLLDTSSSPSNHYHHSFQLLDLADGDTDLI